MVGRAAAQTLHPNLDERIERIRQLEAIEAVCRPEELGLDAVDGVASLHDKSLVRRSGHRLELLVAWVSGGPSRFTFPGLRRLTRV